jgi:hypothetical protein
MLASVLFFHFWSVFSENITFRERLIHRYVEPPIEMSNIFTKVLDKNILTEEDEIFLKN